jgi:hypothetical protein
MSGSWVQRAEVLFAGPLLHVQVAERSLFLWNHEYIITLVAQYRQVSDMA